MAKPFPDHPNLVGGYAPIQMECDAPDLIVEGELPLDLNGTLYRNGPNPQFAPRGQYHWFGGDGMVHAFQIDQGKVAYSNRWARTVKWNLENQAGESLFAAFNPMENDPRVANVETNGIANTNVIWHGNKLLALVESNAPFELDPVTLESIGSWTFNNKLKGAMSAHPKIDPETGEMLLFAYNADGIISPRMAFHVADRDGNLIRSEWFDAPYAAMVHDFITTRDYIIFPIMPLTGSMERAMQGGPVYAWEAQKSSYIGIMPRNGTVEDIRWFEGDPAYVFHPMNAHNDGEKIICEVCQYEEAPLFPHADGSKPDPEKSSAKLMRWVFDLSVNTNTYKVEQLDDMRTEFPRLDERFAGLSYRHGYFACVVGSGAEGNRYNGIGHIDLSSGEIKTFNEGDEFAISEPVFVPRQANSPEGEGYLLATVYNSQTDKSHLIILDAENIDAGPLARAMLDHRVPFGFHGNWRSAH